MPITNNVLTAEEFTYLQQNITDQVATVAESTTLALSGLHYVVLLQVDAPEVDLIQPFYDQVGRMDGLQGNSNWVSTVAALNLHAVTRGTSDNGTTLSTRLNLYLSDNSILVSQTYATLSAAAGFTIDAGNIEA